MFFGHSVIAGGEGLPDPSIKGKSGWFDLRDKFHEKRVYLYWGYNRDDYLNSNIHIHGPGYNFTMYNTAASDKPTRFAFPVYFGPNSLTIPQYNYRGGFFIVHNIHVSFGIDHMKYVVVQNQTLRMTGTIDSSVSQQYAGNYANKNVVLTPDFIRLQHTNGLNLVTADVAWLMPIYHTQKDIIHIGWNFGAGALIVVTRTEFHFMNVFYYNPFHLSGLTVPFYTGPRIDFWKCLFIAFEVKGGEVFLPWAPAENTPTSGIKQNITFLEWYGVFGLSFPVEKSAWPFLKHRKKPGVVLALKNE